LNHAPSWLSGTGGDTEIKRIFKISVPSCPWLGFCGGSPFAVLLQSAALPADPYLLTMERIIERISMIENAIRKMRSHFVLPGSLVLVCLFF
jgi:hypothetical protein